MSRHIDFIAAAQLTDLFVAVSATAILIACAIMVVRFLRFAARRFHAWTQALSPRAANRRGGHSQAAAAPLPFHPNCRGVLIADPRGRNARDRTWIGVDPPLWEWPV